MKEDEILKAADSIRERHRQERRKQEKEAERLRLLAERAAKEMILLKFKNVGKVMVEGRFVIVPGIAQYFEPTEAYQEIYDNLHLLEGKLFRVTFELSEE